MDQDAPALIGIGIYSVPEAARITGVSAGRIRRWVRGYSFRSGDDVKQSPRLWAPDLQPIDHSLALSFRDLIEVRFVDFFLSKGVAWKELREASACASELVGSSHPFSTKRFKTDGRKIFATLRTAGRFSHLLQVVDRQFAIFEVLDPLLYAGLEFRHLDVIRWFPLESSRRIMIDPQVAFGQPVVNPEGVPTRALARAVLADGDAELVARSFAVSRLSVQAAVEFEEKLAA